MTPQTLLVFAILWTANIALAASPQDLLTAYEAKSAKVESGSSAIATMCWGVNAMSKKKQMCSLG
jgi:hypothetical protein